MTRPRNLQPAMSHQPPQRMPSSTVSASLVERCFLSGLRWQRLGAGIFFGSGST
jgi:hypothetical protein